MQTKYPLQHLSIRVPWHDNAWNGTICQCPGRNTSCLKLRNIAENKDDERECELAGQSIEQLSEEDIPPCSKERGTFMASFAYERSHSHPYAQSSAKTHAHFSPTFLRYPAYGTAGLPFRWMMKKFVWGGEGQEGQPLVDRYPLEGLDQGLESKIEQSLFKTNWLQDHENHRQLLDCFWGHIREEESLVFFYAKQVPLVEDTGRRVIVGVGRVKKVGSLVEYDYNENPDGKIRSLLWERMVTHSIRPDHLDGFILPYHEALRASKNGEVFDPSEVVAYAPEDRFDEFSYATEHVGHDASIESLLACRAALLRASELFPLDTSKEEKWIDRELGRLWKKRGAFPGLGPVLSALGLPMGNFIAEALVDQVGENGNPWRAFDAALEDVSLLPVELRRHMDSTITRTWSRIRKKDSGKSRFYELLSRIALTDEQARFIAIKEERKEAGVNSTLNDYLENPYLIYEDTRFTVCPISIEAVDRGMFPTRFVRENHPIPEPSEVKTAVDARRLRALTIRELEAAAALGDTLVSIDHVVRTLRAGEERKYRKDSSPTDVTRDLLETAEEETFEGLINLVKMGGDEYAYQLQRFAALGQVIRKRVNGALSEDAVRHDLSADWRQLLDKFLDREGVEEADEMEVKAREEKSEALAELAASRFSVLIGPAGTGKTTLLSVLCKHPDISSQRILLLAPTGKARVRMESIAKEAGSENFIARTLAQHLSRTQRYEGRTQRYLLNDEPSEKVAATVIVDECSMLTEDMLASLIDSLRGVQRLILVGDPRQLPPIGAGRPFVDIVSELAPENVELSFPRVAPGYAELTIPRRQGAGNRDDLLLASWFGGMTSSPGDDQIFEILNGQRKSETIHFIRWETPGELESAIPGALASHLDFSDDLPEETNFSRSLGAQIDSNAKAWFNAEFGNMPSSGKMAEAWQILTPVRQQPWGVDPLNHFIHQRYKGAQVSWARNQKWKLSIPKPAGDQQIIYGDKVINSRNWTVPKSRLYPKPDERGYLANGEIGMVVGHRRTKKRNWDPAGPEIEFSSQIGTTFRFYPNDFGEEGEAALDLAYALTIHKAQGSEFDVVFLVLPRSPLMLSRELLYTALTRQRKKVVILHQGDATALHGLTSEKHSATATRLTNLFTPPKPVELKGAPGKFLEDRLIHRTSKGIAVRSKSEVIIGNLLEAKGIEYAYEEVLELGEASKYPDFTIIDEDTGRSFYWEHCGMLHVPDYAKRWKTKLDWYHANGVTEKGGPNGRLIVTRDDSNGSFDSASVAELIDSLF